MDYLEQLKEFTRVCYYCGKIFSTALVNTGCFVNRSKALPYNCVRPSDAVSAFHSQEPPEDFGGTLMHYWGQPYYKDNILKFFVILDNNQKLIENPTIGNTAQFFIAVMVAKMKKHLMEHQKSLSEVFGKMKVDSTKYFEMLSFKYHLSNETNLTVDEIDMIAELLVKLTWTEERALKDQKCTTLVKRRIAEEVLGGFDKYDFWFMRYKDVVQEGIEKAKDMTMYDDTEDKKEPARLR